jgi:hypothetical protein
LTLCPAHSDSKPSLSISEGNNRRVLLHCLSNRALTPHGLACRPASLCPT